MNQIGGSSPADQRGSRSRLAVEHEAPDQGGHDRRNGPRHENGSAAPAPGRGRCDSWPAPARSPTTSSRLTLATAANQTVCPSAVPEPAIPERLDIVVESDERPAQPRHPEIVEVERFPDRPGQRKQGDEQDGDAPPAPTSPGEPRLSRSSAPRGSVGGNVAPAEPDAIEQLLHLRRGAARSAARGSACRVSAR